MKKKNYRFVSFRFFLICIFLTCALFIPLYRWQDARAQRRTEELYQYQSEIEAELARSDLLRHRVRQIGTDAFKEREVRRRFGITREDVIRFVLEQRPLEERREAESPLPEVLDKDWSNFN